MVQDVLDRRRVVTSSTVEIRSRYGGEPHGITDLRHLGLTPLLSSRLIVLDNFSSGLTGDMAAALHDPLAEVLLVNEDSQVAPAFVDVFCAAGVTDAEGETASLALRQAGAIVQRCRTGTRLYFEEMVPTVLRSAVERVLGNPLIHTFSWSDALDNADRASVADGSPWASARRFNLDQMGRQDLLRLSREEGLALDEVEMDVVQEYFRRAGRAATDVELQSIALAWSEHCSHKTFKATIEFDGDRGHEIIHGLLADCIVVPTNTLRKSWVRSAFVDNAGVIAFNDDYNLVFKVETHNHPSALEPFGGAHTGVGGVIRDVLAVSAVPIANTDVLCFGNLDIAPEDVPVGTMHPRTTMRGVVRGVADYGNNMGIPTVGGAVFFDPGYTTNPLVHCGTVGLAPRGAHPREPQPGDAVMLLGGRTGRDGLHGATMSSETLDRASVATSTVQIGAPITEKVLRDVLPQLRDERLYHAINDCGAGGLCSAVGEMAEDLGVELDLALVPLKYQGLSPWEIWLSEAQERMVLAVPPASVSRVQAICGQHDLDATVLGTLRNDRRLHLRYGTELVADLDLALLYDGAPRRVLDARFTPSNGDTASLGDDAYPQRDGYADALLRLLAHPNICSKEEVIRRYDYEVQGATVIKPLVGYAGPSDAAVIQPLAGSWRGAVVAHGINPLYGVDDPYQMALLAVDEALRNLTATGGSIDYTAILDNFCWGEVDTPESLGRLVRAAQGCRDAVTRYGVPFISGKDSLRNTSVNGEETHSIPGTLLISAVGVIEDVRHTVTMDLKERGSDIFILGETSDELGGSHLHLTSGTTGGHVPAVRGETPECMRRLSQAIAEGLVLSCHDLSEGGLAVAASEMALAGGIGMRLDLGAMPGNTEHTWALAFAESAGRFLIEVSADRASEFEACLQGLPCARIGTSEEGIGLIVTYGEVPVLDVPLSDLDAAWRTPLAAVASLPPSPAEVDSTRLRAAEQVSESNSRWNIRPQTGTPRALVLVGPGINCDAETLEACRQAGAVAEPVHLKSLVDGSYRLDDFGLLVLPGGFSYGDHLGAGAMLATVLRHRLMDDLERFIAAGRPVLGICNGFQVLARLGLLGPISLVPNSTEQFECRWVRLSARSSPCPFLDGLETLELPIAHGQGRVVVEDGSLIDVLPLAPLRYDDNPNGSIANIAAVCSAAGNVLGLMPHPERYLTRYHHPHRRAGAPDGLRIFQNAVRYAAHEL